MSDKERTVCGSCGASFDKDEPKCPYCGTLNPYGAEKEYKEKLEDIREKLDVVDDIAKASYIGPLKKGVQAFLIVFAISMAIFAFGVSKQISLGKGNQKKRRDDVDKKIDRIIAFKGNEDELNTLFEEKKYDG